MANIRFQQISSQINENISYFNQILGVNESFDIGYREIIINDKKVLLYYVTGLCDTDFIIEIFKRILVSEENQEVNLFDHIHNNLVHQQVSITNNIYEISTNVLSGLIGIIVEGEESGFVIDVRKYPGRGPEEPDTERVVRGSRDGYTENIILNTALTRRRIRDHNLRIELYKIGEGSKTDVCLAYIVGVTDTDLVREVRARLKNVVINDLTMTDKQLEEIIVDQGFNPFPKVRYTERPDIVATHLYQGQVAILVDNTPSIILTPITYFDHIQHAEEYRQVSIVGTFLRLTRFVGVLASLFLMPIWYMLTVHPEYLPDTLPYLRPSALGDIPLIWQILIAEIGIEFLRMAAIHTPNSLSTAMGIIAGLIIGQLAIDLGFFIPEVVFYASVSQIGNYATPSYELSLANKISKLFFILFVFLLGFYGFIISVFVWIIYLARIKTFKKPYLYPLIPLNISDLIKIFIRFPFKNKKKHHKHS